MGRNALLKTIIASCAVSLLISTVSMSAEPARIQSLYPGDVLMWNHINNSEPPIPLVETPKGAILPHHAITTVDVARFYKGLSSQINPEVIFVIGPNHYESGAADIITADSGVYETVYGGLDIDEKIAGSIATQGGASVDNRIFEKEHSIYFHAPFIKKYFPSARIVPILIKWKTPEQSCEKLARILSKYHTGREFFIASVDFSHFQNRTAAFFHDESSFATISNFDFTGINNLEIDSPCSVYTIEKIMLSLGYIRVKRVFHSDTGLYTKKNEPETTSHQYFVFTKGSIDYQKTCTVFFAGNIKIKNDHLFYSTNWEWDRSYQAEDDQTIMRYLKNIRGQEDRFLAGSDLYLFDLPEYNKPFAFTINSLKISTVKFRQDVSRIKDHQRKISELSKKNDYLIIMYEFTDTVLNEKTKKEIRHLMDFGGHLFIGKGFSLPYQEKYKNTLIVYSLGDFITDNTDSSGEMRGIVFTKKEIRQYPFKITIEKGYPCLSR
jgi:AmmeMemoRadiSam system protein B